jgi:hypothetical protein
MKPLKDFATAVKVMREKQKLHPNDTGKDGSERVVDEILKQYGGLFGLYFEKSKPTTV